jgi:hypothetical protein
MSRTIVLVQCTNTKRDEPAPAGDLYDESALFRSQRAYAQALGDAWYILSAEHGFVDPDTVLEPYNTHIDDVDSEEWAESVGDALGGVLTGDETVVITAGAKYADPLTPELEHRYGVDVVEPLRGLGIGSRQKRMNERVAEVSHAGLHG